MSVQEKLAAILEDLEAEERLHMDRISEAEAVIVESKERLKIVQVKREFARDICGAVADELTHDQPSEYHPGENGFHHSGLKPAVAVKQLLERHPEGLPVKKIVDELVDIIDTTSPDRSRLLYNTVWNLRKRGIVDKIKGPDGKTRVVLKKE